MIFQDSRLQEYPLVVMPHKTLGLIETFPPFVVPMTIPAGSIAHTIQAGDRIDLLAYQYYGDFIPIFWWIIMSLNPWLTNPHDLTDLYIGRVLTIPPKSFVRLVVDGRVS